jgi:hypothetical protein
MPNPMTGNTNSPVTETELPKEAKVQPENWPAWLMGMVAKAEIAHRHLCVQ